MLFSRHVQLYLRTVTLLHLALVPHLDCLLQVLLEGSSLIIEEVVIADVVAQEHEEGGDAHGQDRERGPYQVHLHF